MLPRVPFAEDFWAFSKAGPKLAKLRLDYESVEPCPLQETTSQQRLSSRERYRVTKMNFGKNDGKPNKSVVVFSSNVTLSGIPLQTYDYIVNGKPALGWIM